MCICLNANRQELKAWVFSVKPIAKHSALLLDILSAWETHPARTADATNMRKNLDI